MKIFLENFKEKRMLFIGGTSCDGKTTISKNIQSLVPNSYIFKMDIILCRLTYKRERVNKEINSDNLSYIEKYYLSEFDDKLPYEIPKYLFNIQDNKVINYYKDFYNWLIDFMNREENKNIYIIIEGCDIDNLGTDFYIKNKIPLIILETPLLITIYRRIKRKYHYYRKLKDYSEYSKIRILFFSILNQMKKLREIICLYNRRNRFIKQISRGIYYE